MKPKPRSKMNKRRLSGLGWVLLICSTMGYGAETKVTYELGTNGALKDKVLPLQKRAELEGVTDFVRLLHRTEIDLTDGKIVERVEEAYLYPSIDAVQNEGAHTITWDSSQEDIHFTEAAVVLADGTTVQLDESTVINNDTDSYDVFTDNRDLILQMPGLEKGAVSLLSYERTFTNRLPYFFARWVRSGSDVLRYEFEVLWDQERPLWHLDDSPLTCEESDKSLRCHADDVPKAQTDYDVDYLDVLPQLVVAAPRGWDDLIELVRERMTGALAQTGGLSDIIEEFQESEDKIAAAHELASRQIRYVSFSRGEHTHTPHAISETLANRYGDCKDKSALLLSLLLEQGFDAYAVLVSTRRRNPDRLLIPSISYFDHMIVCVNTPDGERCLDPTDSYSDSEELSSWVQGKVRLNLMPGSRPSSLPQSLYRWRLAVNSQTTVDSDVITEKTRRKFIDGLGARYRESLGAMDAETRVEWLTEQYKEVVGEPLELQVSVENTEEIELPLVVTSEAKFDSNLQADAALNYQEYAYFIRQLVEYRKSENQHYDYHFDGMHLTGQHQFRISKHWNDFEAGSSVVLNSRFGIMTRTFTPVGEVIHVSTSIKMPNQVIRLGELHDFNRFLDLVSDETRIRIWGRAVTEAQPN